MRGTRLTAVGDEEALAGSQEAIVADERLATAQRGQAAAIQMMALALKSLSQRALIALGNLFTLLTASSVFVLWYTAPPEPTTAQIIRLALYAGFVLVLNFVRRK